ncbi:MAG: hypothetical protein WD845_10145 [Pirellulales bacterium]
MADCPVCKGTSADIGTSELRDAKRIRCDACGDFDCSLYAEQQLDEFFRKRPKLRSHVSGFLRESSERRRAEGGRRVLLVTSANKSSEPNAIGLEDALASAPLPVQERLDALLSNLVRLSDFPGAKLALRDGAEALGYAENRSSLLFLLQQLEVDGLISLRNKVDISLVVMPRGWNRFAELERGKIAANPLQGFIAMYMRSEVRHQWEPGLRDGVTRAGYDPLVIDGIDFVGSISDRIIAEIRKSRFVVADFTEHRQNVYFEAGFAEGIGIPVFFTCRRDQIDKLHFDKRQENTIGWADVNELAERLHRRIEAVIGRPATDR